MYSPTTFDLFQSLITSERPTIGNGKFPVELLQLVFSHLPWLDLICCRLTCRLWAQSVPLSSHFVKYREASPRRPYTVSGVEIDANSSCRENDPGIPKLYIRVAATLSDQRRSDMEEHDYEVKFLKCSETQLSAWASRRLNPVLLNLNASIQRLSGEEPVWHSPFSASPVFKPSAPWHAMYICLPPISQIRVIAAIDLEYRVTPTTDRDEWYHYRREQSLEDEVSWCIDDGWVVKRQEGVLVDDIIETLKDMLKDVQGYACTMDAYIAGTG